MKVTVNKEKVTITLPTNIMNELGIYILKFHIEYNSNSFYVLICNLIVNRMKWK